MKICLEQAAAVRGCVNQAFKEYNGRVPFGFADQLRTFCRDDAHQHEVQDPNFVKFGDGPAVRDGVVRRYPGGQ
jgi:hypothetical protein